MPHLSVEYSAGLDGMIDADAFCARLHEAAFNTGLFEIGALRVRAYRAAAYAIADLLPGNNFMDMTMRIGAGRSHAEKKQLGDALFGAATSCLAHLFETQHFALSLEIREIDPGLSWKRNAIHQRLR